MFSDVLFNYSALFFVDLYKLNENELSLFKIY